MIVVLMQGAVIILLAGPMGDAGASPLVQVSVDMDTSKTASVTYDKGDGVTFEGWVTVEQPQGLSQTTTLTATSSSGWQLALSPEQFNSNNPGSSMFHVTVWVPAGTADGHTDTVTVRASTKVPILSATVASDTGETTVDNTSPAPEWVVRITEPSPNEVYTTDGLTISGTASFNQGNITSVEVKVCTGPWQVATGTDQWTIDYDCSYLDDGEHSIKVKARSGEDDVSPVTEIAAVQDRSSVTEEHLGGNVVPEDKGRSNESYTTFIFIGVIVIVAAILGYWRYSRRQKDTLDYLMVHS